MPQNNEIQDFLYSDPDTGMVVCMVADGDGFRPATAFDEIRSSNLHAIYVEALSGHSVSDFTFGVSQEDASINEFMGRHERSFGAPSMA